MGRTSERISSALSTIECPGCGKRVVPITARGDRGAPGAGATSAAMGGRWSFIWQAPSGTICPECFFPLARYLRRLKWVRTLSTGLVLLVAALMLFIVSLLNPRGTGAGNAAKLVALVGAVVLVVGLGGIVVGGRRPGADDRPQ